MNIQPIGYPISLRTDERQVQQPAEPAAAQPVQGAQAGPTTTGTPSREQVAAAVKKINQSIPASSQSLEFSIDDDSKQTIVKVVDQNTKEVVRQIPSVEALEIAKSLDKMMGLLISQKV